MNILQYAFPIVAFVAVFGLVMFVVSAYMPSAAQERLKQLAPSQDRPGPSSWLEKAARASASLAKLSLPEDGWESSATRTRFMYAGIRYPWAPQLFFGTKTFLASAFPLLAYLVQAGSGAAMGMQAQLFLALVAAATGYYLPNIILSRMVNLRQREIFEAFPDALDLMTVCVEAGLGVEAALNRVAEDLEYRSEALSEELRLVGLELRAGSDRQRALRNLAARTGVSEVESWAAMLIQADRFGTSIADSLRVYSDMMRTKRRQRAEEAAAKIGLKLLFPLIFCIFPALMLVLMGPAIIQISLVLLPSMGGVQ